MAGEQTRVTSMVARAGSPDPERCLVQLNGPRLGRRVVLGAEPLRIGRDEDNELAVDLDTVSRHHARVYLEAERVLVEDLGSTNGTWVNDRELEGPTPLRSGDRLKVGGALFKYLTGDDVEAQYHETLYSLAISDGLTGVSNKRALLEYLER